MLKMKSENQDKMNQMIQNMTTQFEREKRSVVEEYTGQLDALRRTLHSERELSPFVYSKSKFRKFKKQGGEIHAGNRTKKAARLG